MWVCYRKDVPQLSYVTDHDASDEFTYCVTGETVEVAARVIYYGVKAFKALKGAPIPPPP